MSIATEITRIQQAKADIKTAIEAKGVTVPSSATIDTYDDYVSQISGGGGGLIQDVSGTPYCSGEDQVVDVQRQISVDGGTSWVNSGSQFTVIVEAGACGGGLVQIPYGTDMSQYVGRLISRIVVNDTTASTSTNIFFNSWADAIFITQWNVTGQGQFSSLNTQLPIDISIPTPAVLTSWNDTNLFNDLQIEWA